MSVCIFVYSSRSTPITRAWTPSAPVPAVPPEPNNWIRVKSTWTLVVDAKTWNDGSAFTTCPSICPRMSAPFSYAIDCCGKYRLYTVRTTFPPHPHVASGTVVLFPLMLYRNHTVQRDCPWSTTSCPRVGDEKIGTPSTPSFTIENVV